MAFIEINVGRRDRTEEPSGESSETGPRRTVQLAAVTGLVAIALYVGRVVQRRRTARRMTEVTLEPTPDTRS